MYIGRRVDNGKALLMNFLLVVISITSLKIVETLGVGCVLGFLFEYIVEGDEDTFVDNQVWRFPGSQAAQEDAADIWLSAVAQQH